MKKFIISLLLIFTFVGCSSAPPPPEEGYVKAKSFEAAHWEGGYEYYTTYEYNCANRYDAFNNEYRFSCQNEPVQHSRWVPRKYYVNDVYKLKLEDCKVNKDKEKECNIGWKSVTEEEYNHYNVGKHYPNDR